MPVGARFWNHSSQVRLVDTSAPNLNFAEPLCRTRSSLSRDISGTGRRTTAKATQLYCTTNFMRTTHGPTTTYRRGWAVGMVVARDLRADFWYADRI